MGAWERIDPNPPFHAPETLDLTGAVVAYDCSILRVVYGHTVQGNPVSVALHVFHVTHPTKPTLWVVEAWASTPAYPPSLPAVWSVADTPALAIGRAIVGVRDIGESRQASPMVEGPLPH